MNVSTLKKQDISELESVLLDEAGQFKVVSYEILKKFPHDHIRLFCLMHGYYCLPTTELIDYLKNEIEGKSAIEIGAGAGIISRDLNIIGTDNLMQLNPQIKAHYESLGQPIVPYGDHVQQIDGNSAVKKYKPSVAIAAWVTHKYNPAEHWRGGNQFGVDKKKLLKSVGRYILIGTESVHGTQPIMNLPHSELKAPWIVSRTEKADNNKIWIWEGALQTN